MTPSAHPLVVIEADPRGHHLYYVRLILDAAHQEGHQAVLWTTTTVVAAAEFEVHLGGSAGHHVNAIAISSGHPDRARARLLRLALSAHPGQVRIVLPHADRVLPQVWHATRRQDVDARLLLMRSPRTPVSSLPQGLRRAGKRVSLRLAVDRESTRVAVLGFPNAAPDASVEVAGKRLPVIPDPPLDPLRLPAKADVRARLGLPEGMIFLLIGRLDRRKGVPEVLDAWQRQRPPNAHLYLVGSLDEDVRANVRSAVSRDGRIVLREGYLSDDDFLAYVKGADTVITTYRNAGPSGVYAAARAVGTAVIAAGNHELVAAVRAAGTGLVCGFTADSMAEAMQQAARGGIAAGRPKKDEPLQRARFTDFFVGT